MKNRTSISLISFATTLLLSIALVAGISSLKKDDDIKARVKIYNFLLADKERNKHCSERVIQQVSKLRGLTAEYTLQLSYGERDLYVKELHSIVDTLMDERVAADTSKLPEDFRKAWSKFAIAAKNNSHAYRSDVNSPARGSINALSEELTVAAEELTRVSKSYGFVLGSDYVLIDEQS